MDKESKQLLIRIQSLIRSSRQVAAHGVSTLQVMTNYEIGRLIIEHEQKGKKRAEYGKQILPELSKELSSEFGRGFSRSNLEYMRRFFLEYGTRIPKIPQTVSGKLAEHEEINQIVPKELPSWQNVSSDSKMPFRLSWSQYVFLLAIVDRKERQFYEIEGAENNWSLRELKRQYDSGLFERLALSRDKKKIKELSLKGQLVEKPEDVLKEPYVLEFLGLDEKNIYSEHDLESAIIDKVERFLLELGKGFLFEARQKRLSFDANHFFVDLVFYNRILRCYVVIDLKIGRLTHQDLGQMQMYVNYFDRFVRSADENPTIGIILCSMKNDALVKLTLPKDTRVYPARYQLYVPSKEMLRQKLLEWMKEPRMKEE